MAYSSEELKAFQETGSWDGSVEERSMRDEEPLRRAWRLRLADTARE
jgi:hypothetical protein